MAGWIIGTASKNKYYKLDGLELLIMIDDEVELYKKRKKTYWFSTIALALSWYVITGIESHQMGLPPLARRSFTLFDVLYFIFIFIGLIALSRWYRKCPKCGHKMIGNYSLKCLNCKFGFKNRSNY